MAEKIWLGEIWGLGAENWGIDKSRFGGFGEEKWRLAKKNLGVGRGNLVGSGDFWVGS